MLKQIDLSVDKSIAELTASYAARTGELDISALASDIETKIDAAVSAGDLDALLAVSDRKKPLLALASSRLCNWNLEVFSAWVTRAIQNTQDDRLRRAISSVLPEITAA